MLEHSLRVTGGSSGAIRRASAAGPAVFADAADDSAGARVRPLPGCRLSTAWMPACPTSCRRRADGHLRRVHPDPLADLFASACCSISGWRDRWPASCFCCRRWRSGMAFSKVIPGIAHQGSCAVRHAAAAVAAGERHLPGVPARGYLSASGGARRLGRHVRDGAEPAADRPTGWRPHSVFVLSGDGTARSRKGCALLLLPLGIFWYGWFVVGGASCSSWDGAIR